MPLKEALHNNHIDSFTQCRLIHIDTNWFYQVQQRAHAVPLYISARNGKLLNAGDWLYAQYLARQFLERQQFSTGEGKAIPDIITPTSLPADHDCCNEATSCILKSKGSRVINAHILTSFDNEYKSINRLLPVYKVSFDRPDGIRVYVETIRDRFAFAIDNRRAVSDEIFRLFHTWGWLDIAGNLKYIIEGGLATLAFFTTLLGIYIFFTTNSKTSSGNKLLKAWRNHRYTAITVALFTLLWSGSGAYHALSKLNAGDQTSMHDEHIFSSDDIHLDPRQLQTIVKRPVADISLAYMDHSAYWRITGNNHSGAAKAKDLMKEMHAGLPPVLYVNDNDRTILPEGEQQYARELATRFSGHAL